ncbi:DUF309 domain-containing protein [Frankia canadensis]|nr:DUF309 domain-containing protein [Frankia canadensis]
MTTSPHPRRPEARPRPGAERPRDALGRPLPFGAKGVVPLDLPAVLPPPAALAAAQHLLDTGRPFQAHEVLEAAWKSADARDRGLWRALTQLAVGITHLARGNTCGGIAVLTRAGEGLAPYAARPPYEVDVAGLRRWIDRRVAEAASPGWAQSPRPPRLLG